MITATKTKQSICSRCGQETDWDETLGEKPLCLSCWDRQIDKVDRAADTLKKYRERHSEKLSVYQKSWRAANKEKMAIYHKNYRARQKEMLGTASKP